MNKSTIPFDTAYHLLKQIGIRVGTAATTTREALIVMRRERSSRINPYKRVTKSLKMKNY